MRICFICIISFVTMIIFFKKIGHESEKQERRGGTEGKRGRGDDINQK